MAYSYSRKRASRYVTGMFPYRYRSNVGNPWIASDYYETGFSRVFDQNHGRTRSRIQDDGGPFLLWREESRPTLSAVAGQAKAELYDGYVVFPQENLLSDFAPPQPLVEPSDSSMYTWGTSAISKVLPTNPAFDLATFIGELRQGRPTIPGMQLLKERSRYLKGSGSEYLNVEFGWLPLIKSLFDFASTVKQSKTILDQYIQGSDRKIRRRYVLEPQIGYRTWSGSTFARPSVSGVILVGTGHETVSVKKWFSGAFRYHVPVGDDLYSKFRRYESLANHLLGIRPTPEVVWNLAPWSWAVDWFTNAGDVMSNISAMGTDGLVMQYGYAMQHHETRGNFIANVHPSYASYFGSSLMVQRDYVYEIKKRVPATPYGFGVDDTSLTERQVAILAALGLSRGGRK